MKCEERATQKNNQQMENKRFLGEAGQQDKRNQGAWTIGEQKKYILFIQKYKYELQNKQKRKDNKIFKNMSNFIQSRDGIQCRSHHMKLLRTHAKIKRIVEHFRRKFRDEFDGNLVFNTSNPNKQTLSPSSDNPLNKFSDFSIVKHEQMWLENPSFHQPACLGLIQPYLEISQQQFPTLLEFMAHICILLLRSPTFLITVQDTLNQSSMMLGVKIQNSTSFCFFFDQQIIYGQNLRIPTLYQALRFNKQSVELLKSSAHTVQVNI